MIRQLYQLGRNRVWGSVLPLELILFVCKRCPLRCAHCFIDEFQTDPASDLPLDVIRRLAGDLPNLLVLMLTGGEPFLRRDLPDVVEVFSAKSHPKVVSIVTSGWFPEETSRAVQKIIHSDTFKTQLVVTVSFDGDRETHDSVRRRKGSYDRALETARRLKELCSDQARLAVGANLTLVPENQGTILGAAQALADTDLFSIMSHNIYRESKPRSAFRGADLDAYRELSRFVQAFSSRFSMGGDRYLGFLHRAKERHQSDLIERTCRTNKYQGLSCEAGRNIGVVYADGSVAACELLPAEWGNVKDRSFAEIWNDQANRKRSRDIRSTECFCTHECFIGASLATQLGGVRDVLLASRRCAATDSAHDG